MTDASDIHNGTMKELLACHCCDHLQDVGDMQAGHDAYCYHCGSHLWYRDTRKVDQGIALNLAALFCFILANSFPLLTLETFGISESSSLFSTAMSLHDKGISPLALLVFLTSELLPLLTILAGLYLLIPIRFAMTTPAKGIVYRVLKAIEPWSMTSVFMMAIAITAAKLHSMAHIIPGIALYALIAFLILQILANRTFSPELIWPVLPRMPQPDKGPTALAQGLIHCHTCAALVASGHDHCLRCQTPLHSRKPDSLIRTRALLISAAILLIPANLYPIMRFSYLGEESTDTIISGIIHLIDDGMWPLGLIVLIASLIVPFYKIASMTFLTLSVHKRSTWRQLDRTRLYRVSEMIGSWSMVDIYLVAILCSLLNMGELASVEPDLGALFFAAAVVTTMFATHSFDPRLIWDVK